MSVDLYRRFSRWLDQLDTPRPELGGYTERQLIRCEDIRDRDPKRYAAMQAATRPAPAARPSRRRAIAREMLRNRWFVALVVLAPLAFALQFTGDRAAIDVATSLVFIAACVAAAAHGTYQRAVDRVEDQILAAAHARWVREPDASRLHRHTV